MPVTLVEPDHPAGPVPALILCHHREGVDEFTLDAGRRLATHGFVVAIPNMYHRRPAGEAWEISRETITDLTSVADLQATRDFVRTQASVRKDSLGIIGHCMGGRSAFLGAAVMPEMKVAVVLYGGGIFKSEGIGMPTPISLAQNIRATILGLYGDQDHITSIEEIRKLVDVLKQSNIRQEFHIYECVGHAFQDFSRSKLYVKEASDDAWKRTFSFLKNNLV